MVPDRNSTREKGKWTLERERVSTQDTGDWLLEITQSFLANLRLPDVFAPYP